MVKFRLPKGALISLIAVVLLLAVAAAAGGGLRWWQHREAAIKTEKAPKLPATISDLQELRLRGYDEAFNKKLQEALSKPNLDDDSRYLLYMQKGHALFGKEDWQGAVEAYRTAESIKPTYDVAELIAETYESAGNKAKAIEYFRIALTRVPTKDNPVADADKQALQLRIQALEVQP